MAQSIVGDKSLAFAKRIARCYVFLKDKKGEIVMSKQLLRCGTSIGANVREGQLLTFPLRMVEEHLDALQVVTEEDKSASDDRPVRE